MRELKLNTLLSAANNYVVDSPQPANISYWWNVGSLLGLSLGIQIITGVTLAMHYNPSVTEAFNSVEHIMRDVNNGWLIRYLHSNTASAFFFLVYLHIGRGLYYGSYKAPRTLVWTVGTIILILMMATAFLGYVLPYGQMSLWGATVITNLMSAIPWIGQDIVEFIWGGFSVNNATLNRFFSLHFVLPFVLAALALIHLVSLHDTAGSGNPLGTSGNYDRVSFAPHFIFKDVITIYIFMLVVSILVFFLPNLLGDTENYVVANPMQTPPAIVPEWYLLPFYAVLRSIPSKLVGVICMFAAIIIILAMVLADRAKSRGMQFKPSAKSTYFIFTANLIFLLILGAKHVESPFIEFGQIATLLYFLYFVSTLASTGMFEVGLNGVYLDRSDKIHNIESDAKQKRIIQILTPSDSFIKLPLKNGIVDMLPESLTRTPILSKYNATISFITCTVLLLVLFINGNDVCDAPKPWGIFFQDSASPQMEGIVELHNYVFFQLVYILGTVGLMLYAIIVVFTKVVITYKYVSHGSSVELFWTITPGLILVFISLISFQLLYLIDEVSDVNMTFYAEGHQWYWSYQYPDFLGEDGDFIEFDSYLTPESDLSGGAFRMLDVDEKVIMPEATHTRFIMASGDVIHSYACPSLGLKADAYPGRLNQASTLINRVGSFFGQCSEVCGILHSSMPIFIKGISLEKFFTFLWEK